jgi:hypothetical protein
LTKEDVDDLTDSLAILDKKTAMTNKPIAAISEAAAQEPYKMSV